MVYPFGINLMGFFRSQFGIAQLSRSVELMLRNMDMPYCCIDIIPYHPLYEGEIPEITTEFKYAINVVCANPNDTAIIIQKYGSDVLMDRYTIGVWAWELEKWPGAPEHLTKYYDEIWTLSEFCKKSIESSVPLPVKVVRFPVFPMVDASYDLPPKFTVLFMFSYISGIWRKAPHLTIEAFIKAFGESEDVQLVIKTNSDDSFPQQRDVINGLMSRYKNIIHIKDNLTNEQKWGLIARSDVCISLHSSGGLEFFPLEGMAMGKAVIATGYSGNLDYMNKDNSILIPYEMVGIPDLVPCYGGRGSWAKADTNIAALCLRRLRDEDLRRNIGLKAKSWIEDEWNMEKCTSILRSNILDTTTRYIPHHVVEKVRVYKEVDGSYIDISESFSSSDGIVHLCDPESTTIVHHPSVPTPIIIPKNVYFAIKYK